MCMRPPRRVNSSSWYSSWKMPDAGGHPLRVAGADDAGVAGVVAVGDRAFPGERHGLEAAVRVPADAALAARERRELLRRAVVHQHERAHALGGQLRAREVGRDEEAVADPVEGRAAVDALDAADAAARASVVGGDGRSIVVVVFMAAQGNRAGARRKLRRGVMPPITSA